MSVLWDRMKARLIFLGIGVLLGVLAVSFTVNQYSTRIEELETIRKTQLREKDEKLLQLETRYSKLETERKKIKSHVHITERTNADGSKERIYDSKKSVESERLVSEQQVSLLKLHQQRKVELLNHEWEKKLIKETRPTASFNVGMMSDFSKYIYVDYNVYGPLKVGLWGSEKGLYGLSLGIAL